MVKEISKKNDVNVYQDKKVLLIGGGGTLGTYTAEELLKLGCSVDVICLEDKCSENEKLTFYKAHATLELLNKLFTETHYDGIVDFIHYREVEDYREVHTLLTRNTEHLIFLSSYRVYADVEHPITENAPMLLDVTDDQEFLKQEKYALSKARCERFLRQESSAHNWTIVRPVISFSERRFDLVTTSGRIVIDKTKSGESVVLPKEAKDLTAGLDWAGNTGKIIANMLFKQEAYQEAYTISSAQNLTWGEVADIYTELIGAEFQWTDTDAYIDSDISVKNNIWALRYDRLFDRRIDNSKVLDVTGLKPEDFISIKEGIIRELARI